MLRPQVDIDFTLLSNVPGVPGNKPSNYKKGPPDHLTLTGGWEVAQLETPYQHPIPNFKATTLVVICSETAQSDQTKPQLNHPQVSQFPMPQPYWKHPQAYQSPCWQAHRDEVSGHWPSNEDDPNLSIERTTKILHKRCRVNRTERGR